MMGVDSFGVETEDVTFAARDGLRLYARRYGAAQSGRRPLLCLAGLTRNGRDFDDLARALARPGPGARTVYTLDSRGRGRSEFDSDWRNYAVPLEMLDVLDFLTAAELSDVAVIGTSRGGLITMLLAAARPAALGAVILNDIGPVIETDGLMRIAGYVGRTPLPNSWADAARMVRDMNAERFPVVSEPQWEELARQFYNETKGRPAPGYDPAVGRSLSVLDGPMPELWPQFEALKRVPLLVLRGEHSDILSAATVAEMGRRHPKMAAVEVKGQGHAPLLKDAPTIGFVRQFLELTDR
jgi:pimeloyl-ACP methyl ester carboxylesterase